MTEDEKLDLKGSKVFDKLDADDKRALKRFLTGQIQNILANEHGIGGQRKLKGQIDKTIELVVSRDSYLDRVANRVLHARRAVDIDKLIRAAVDKAAADAVAVVVGAAAGRIKINVFVEPDPLPGVNSENFARF